MMFVVNDWVRLMVVVEGAVNLDVEGVVNLVLVKMENFVVDFVMMIMMGRANDVNWVDDVER